MQHPIDQKLTGRGRLFLFLKGLCMGTADIIPGVSGGTIAFLIGIYEDFIQSIRSFDAVFVKNVLAGRWREAFDGAAWQFLSTLLTGILTAIVILSKVINWLMVNKPVYLHAFFFGLIFATVPIIARIKKRWTTLSTGLLVFSAAASFFLVQMVPVQTPDAPWFLFFSGALAISAMILPGISGSFILFVLGKYHFIINAINERDIFSIGMVGLGVIFGIITFVRVLSWLFRKFHDNTIAVLTGLVIGSLVKVWPWKETMEWMEGRHGELIPIKQVNVWPAGFTEEMAWAGVFMILGFILAFLLNREPSTDLENLHKKATHL